jgi:predicted nucleic acid-binding protein
MRSYLAYLRVATHPHASRSPQTLSAAAANVNRLLAWPKVRTGGEPGDFWHLLRGIATADARGKLVHDAHVVALMQAHGVRTIWTRDRDFRRFDGIRVVDPFV